MLEIHYKPANIWIDNNNLRILGIKNIDRRTELDLMHVWIKVEVSIQ